MGLPVKALLENKKAVLKKINGVITPNSIPVPTRPETWPEKPKTAMQIFTLEKRAAGEDIAKIGDMWKELSSEERGKYDDMQIAAQKEYEQGMREFKASDEGKTYFRDTKIALKKRKVLGAKIKFLKDMPKKPKAAIHLFMTRTA